MQRPGDRPGPAQRIGGIRLGAGGIGIDMDQRVQRRVVACNAIQIELCQVAGRDGTIGQRLREGRQVGVRKIGRQLHRSGFPQIMVSCRKPSLPRRL